MLCIFTAIKKREKYFYIWNVSKQTMYKGNSQNNYNKMTYRYIKIFNFISNLRRYKLKDQVIICPL